jgi:hypothetical protein
MVLNLDDEILIDMDKVSAVLPGSKYIIVDGTKMTILKEKNMNSIIDIFKWQHQSYMYDKNKKRIK